MAVKKLIEVALPLDAINAASTREKSLRHGNPSTLHLWWARRPLASARAVIWASLVDDPSSHPEEFPTEEEQDAERQRLFRILEELVVWENTNHDRVLNEARHEIRKSMGKVPIKLLDPFAGGGTIPLEAQRLGLKAYAQDLNPVAVIINKAMIEIPQSFRGLEPVNPISRKKLVSESNGCRGLSEDVEYYGTRLKAEAWKELASLYPTIYDPKTNARINVMACAWTRTITCPNPACHCEVPLVHTFDLCKRKGKQVHVEPRYDSDGKLEFSVESGLSPIDGTVNRKGGTCPRCGGVIPYDYIRETSKTAGLGRRLMAIIGEGKGHRTYLNPTEDQVDASNVPLPEDYPTGKLANYPGRMNTIIYGLDDFYQLFTNRQLAMLTTFTNLISSIRDEVIADAQSDSDRWPLADGQTPESYADAVATYLALVVDKLVDYHSTICIWHTTREVIANTMRRQSIPMTWDYVEGNPFCNSSGCFDSMLKWVTENIRDFGMGIKGVARQYDAAEDCGLRNIMVSTDPPYYDNIGYADVSDYFYVWLRRSLRSIYPDLLSTIQTPKSSELVADPYRFDGGKDEARRFFENGMAQVCRQMYKYSRDDIPVTVFYAYKQHENGEGAEKTGVSAGWETMLNALISAGFCITGTWPMRTELTTALKGKMNALATSIVLVCRKRPEDAPMATRRELVNALKRELRPALDKLRTSNIAPVDLAQSAIGPGIGVYSRYSKVLEADGSEMTVRSALQIINQELDLYFSDQDSDLDRNSRFCVDLYTQCAFNEIRFGEADVLARAKNTSIEGLAAKGALSSSKGVVRLLGRDEIRDRGDWSFTWLFCQRLTHAMETGGVEECARLLKDVYDSRTENARALAYRLFTIADKKGWNGEAFAYNSLVVAWPEIQARAAQLQAAKPKQYTLDDLAGMEGDE